jgi:hypothetical protein
MSICENCGNQYDRAFQLVMGNKEYWFDSFECAINLLAPKCNHCQTKIIGHGVESGDLIFCCAHCATAIGVSGLKDHAVGY